jgi:hypothetical protein
MAIGVQDITTVHSPHPETWPQGEPMRAQSVWAPHCPRHATLQLSNGPVVFDCPEGHTVQAADLDHEFHGRLA